MLSPEMAIVMRYAAYQDIYRSDRDRRLDAYNFIQLVHRTSNFDEDNLRELAGCIFRGAGERILALVRMVRAGDALPA